MDSCGIRGVSISHKDNGLFWICGANCLSHRNNGGKGFSGVGQMVGRDLEVLGRDEEEDIVMFSEDLDVGFIPSAYVINWSFAGEVKAMAIEGGRGCVVQYGLIRDRDGEDRPEDEGRFSCTEGEGDVKSQDKAKNIRGVVDFGQVDGRLFGTGMGKLIGLVVVFSILVGELKLGTAFLGQEFFPFVEFIHIL